MTREEIEKAPLSFGRFRAYGNEKMIAEGYDGSSCKMGIADEFDNSHGYIVKSQVSNISEAIPVKYYDVDMFAVHEIARCIREAVVDGIDILSISMSASSNTKELREVVDLAERNNVLIFNSAGNTGNDLKRFPASYPTTLNCGSIDNDVDFSEWASYGETLDFVGFGENMPWQDEQGRWWYAKGTTLTTPALAATAALLWDKFYKENGVDPSVEYMRSELKKMVIDLGPKGKDERFGYGFLTHDVQAFKDVYMELMGIGPGMLTERVERIKDLIVNGMLSSEEAEEIINKDYNIIATYIIEATDGTSVCIPIFNLKAGVNG